MPIASPTDDRQWSKIQPLLADGEWHLGSEIAEAMGWGSKGVCARMAHHVDTGAVMRELKTIGKTQRSFYKLAPDKPESSAPGLSVDLPRHTYSADRKQKPLHDHIGTARIYDRRPGGACS